MATKNITGSYPSGYALDPAFQTLNISSAATVGGTGVTTTASQPSTINNLGAVQGTANGITLSDGGAITNGSATNSTAAITGVNAIVANNASATVKNSAQIKSDAVVSGYNSTTAISVALNQGGVVTNSATGQITNGVLIATTPGTVTNDGIIGGSISTYSKSITYDAYNNFSKLDSSVGPSVTLAAGGVVRNGTAGNTSAVLANGIEISTAAGTVTNLGLIGSPTVNNSSYSYSAPFGFPTGLDEENTSIQMTAGGSVTNGTSSITSAKISNGILISGAGGTVTNDGTIGGATSSYSSGERAPYGARSTGTSSIGPSITLMDGGTLTNGTMGNGAADISNGIVISGALGKVVNNGTIGRPSSSDSYSNFYAFVGGTYSNGGSHGVAVGLHSGGSVTNGSPTNTAATINGGIDISGGVGTIVNHGAISGGPSSYSDTYVPGSGGYSSRTTGYSISLHGGGSVTNGSAANTAATINGGIEISGDVGTIVNHGLIAGSPNTYFSQYGSGYPYSSTTTGYSISLHSGGSVTNGGTSDTAATITTGIDVAGGTGKIINYGTIQNNATDKPTVGIKLEAGGSVTNGSAANTSALIEGGTAIAAYGSPITVTNSGRISSNPVGAYPSHPDYGVSIALNAGGSVTNLQSGTITNGVSISGATGTVVNQGLIGGPVKYFKDTTDGQYIPIVGPSVTLAAGGTITNGSATNTSATLSNGIEVSNGVGTVKNFGIISAGAPGHQSFAGIDLGAGGTVTNGSSTDAAAEIDSRVIFHGPGTLTNFGTLHGVSFFSDGCTFIEEGTGQLVGTFFGQNSTLQLAREGGPGTFTGLSTSNGSGFPSVDGFTTVIVNGGAFWTFANTNNNASTLTNNGTLTNAGTFANPGMLTNEGTFTNGSTLTNSGTVINERIFTNNGTLTNAATLTNNSSLTNNSALNNNKGGTLLNAGTLKNAGTLTNGGTFTISGQVINSGSIVNSKSNSSVTVTLAFDGDYSILTDKATNAGQFTNAGLVRKMSGTGTSIIRTGTASLIDTGTIEVDSGILELSGATIDITGAIKGAGTIEFGPGATTLGAGTSITTAGLTIAGAGAQVTVARTLGYDGAFSAEIGTELTIDTGDLLKLTGPASFFRDTVGGAGRLMTTGSTSVGVVTLGGTAQWYNAGLLTETSALTIGDSLGNKASFVNQATGVFDLAGNVGIGIGTATTSTFTNQGLLAKTAGGTSTIGIGVVNTGMLESASGTLDLQQAVTGPGGTWKIDAGKVIEADAAVSGQTVDFNGGGDKLVLTDAAHFAGKLQDFGAGDRLDLRQFDTAATTLAYVENAGHTAGTLTVTDGALQAKIALLGDFTATAFHAASDGVAGGTFITYTPPATPMLLAAPHS